jgi:hypothetical protein
MHRFKVYYNWWEAEDYKIKKDWSGTMAHVYNSSYSGVRHRSGTLQIEDSQDKKFRNWNLTLKKSGMLAFSAMMEL